MATTSKTQLQQRILKAIKSDPKKTGALVVLVTLLGMMWVRMAMKQHENPANAASDSSYMTSHNAVPTDGAASGAAPDHWLHAEIPPLSRNLFGVKLDNFPLDGTARQPADENAIGDGFWDQLAKSMASRADQKKERAALLENVQQQASALKLQSIMMGAKPRAVVNGEMVEEGDIVASGTGEARAAFRVLKIEARRIIIEREGIKLEILMN
jgi:hypothetical protein